MSIGPQAKEILVAAGIGPLAEDYDDMNVYWSLSLLVHEHSDIAFVPRC